MHLLKNYAEKWFVLLFYFESSEQKNKQYLWIGELKKENIQKIVNEFSSEMARVGIDEHEVFRRLS